MPPLLRAQEFIVKSSLGPSRSGNLLEFRLRGFSTGSGDGASRVRQGLSALRALSLFAALAPGEIPRLFLIRRACLGTERPEGRLRRALRSFVNPGEPIGHSLRFLTKALEMFSSHSAGDVPALSFFKLSRVFGQVLGK